MNFPWVKVTMGRLNRTTTFDGVPMFVGHALMLRDARKHGAHFTVTSADRRRGVAEKYGKLSQYALYVDYWIKHLPGFYPANKPGRSTHELRSDGFAYRGPVGRPLAWWQLGIDAVDQGAGNDCVHLVRTLRSLGYEAWRPYKTGAEAHHFNLKKDPTRNLRHRHLA